MNIDTGDLVFFRDTTSIYGKAITIYNHIKHPAAPKTQKNLTHVGIVTTVNQDTVRVAEAKASTQLQTYTYNKNQLETDDSITVASVDANVDAKTVKQYAERFEGRMYDYISIAALVLPFISFNRNARELFCSEAVARILNKASTMHFDRPETITPMKRFRSPNRCRR